MAHYAWVDKDNKVVNLSVVKDENNMKDGVEDEATGQAYLMEVHKERDFVKNGGKFIKYSLNTRRNKHYNENELSDTQEKAFRGNAAQRGGTWDPENNIFIPVKPEGCDSWTYNYEEFEWRAPVDPTDEQKENFNKWGMYWVEETQEWKEDPIIKGSSEE